MFKRLLILDRDGVINEKPTVSHKYILNIRELLLRETVLKEISNIQNKNIKVVVATNQQCIGKGLIKEFELYEIHEYINSKLMEFGGHRMDFYVCGHLEEEKCPCRKPRPGLLLNAIAKNEMLNKELDCLFIGDSPTDQEAALLAGIPFKLVTDEHTTASILRSVLSSEF